jgi:arsenate reductase
MSIKVYEYAGCSTCKKALKFLKDRKVDFEVIPIVDRPPTVTELRAMLKHLNGELKKLFNTSGQQYRELKMSERLPGMSESEAISLLSKNGKLIKRPFVLASDWGVVGFNEAEWKKQIGR